MSSTEKQNAKEKCSMQSGVMCDLENMNMMLRNFPRKDIENIFQREV